MWCRFKACQSLFIYFHQFWMCLLYKEKSELLTVSCTSSAGTERKPHCNLCASPRSANLLITHSKFKHVACITSGWVMGGGEAGEEWKPRQSRVFFNYNNTHSSFEAANSIAQFNRNELRDASPKWVKHVHLNTGEWGENRSSEPSQYKM